MGSTVNRIVQSFGQIVGKSAEKHPKRAQNLLKLGYAVAYAYCSFQKYFPGRKLLPSQIYSSKVINRLISQPLYDPQNSAVVNIFFPCELLHAAGIKPQVAEGLAGYLNGTRCEHFFIDHIEKTGMPKTLCSFHKALLGAAFSGVLPRPRFAMFTTMVCDANVVTSKALADLWNIPLFTIDVPGRFDEDAVKYVEHQLKQAVEFIEHNTRRKFDYGKLRQIIKRENRSVRLYKRYLEELSGKYIPNDLTAEMNRLLLTHVLSGTRESEKYFEMLLEDGKNVKPPEGGASRPVRILWCHTVPYWQTSIREIFDRSDKYQLLCSDLNLDGLVELDEDEPLRSLAEKLLRNPLAGPAERRARHIADMARYLNADGVVYFNSWGCKKTLGGSVITRQILEHNGIPVLLLDGDGCDRNNVNEGQMKTRLQAFLEILEARK